MRRLLDGSVYLMSNSFLIATKHARIQAIKMTDVQIPFRSIKMADENISDATRTGHAYVASVNILVLTLVFMPVLISQV